MHKAKDRNCLNDIIFVPIGEEQNGRLTTLAEDHAKTKKAIIKAIIGRRKKVVVLFNYNHGPSSRAVTLMTGELANVKLRGEYNSNLSTFGNFNAEVILELMEKYEDMDVLILAGSLPVCYQMPNHYAKAHGIGDFKMKTPGPDEVYRLNRKERTLDIIQYIPQEIEQIAEVSEGVFV